MTEDQVKAAKSLKRALTKCAKAGLALYTYTDIGIFVAPKGEEHPILRSGMSGDVLADWFEEHGYDVKPKGGITFDGGAGV